MPSRVSICLPNLNTLPFLKERFETIIHQDFKDWELFVYDSFSDDGSWEYLQRLAGNDSRIRLAQGPREGPYAAWNECIRRTTGEFIYIATSDDTFAPDCLGKLVAALENHRDCELAHCPLVTIDASGSILAEPRWPECTAFGRGIGTTVNQPHIRRAPYDGLLHLTGDHVYLSITQLLIRRSLFERVGDFKSTWGSISDFNWEMRAGLAANVVHVPDTWATWRLHPRQLSASIDIRSSERDRKIDDMIRDAVETCEAKLDPAVTAELKIRWITRAQAMRSYYAGLRHRRRSSARKLFQIRHLIFGKNSVRCEILSRLRGKPKWGDEIATEIRLWLECLGFTPVASLGPPPQK